MPPKGKLTKTEILTAAVNIVRDKGGAALNARSLASRLKVSTQPIFSNYKSMESLREDVIAYANRMYQWFLRQDMSSGEYPAYKAAGMAYIRFAREEKELFKLLFMRDRSQEIILDSVDEIKPIIEIIHQNTGLSLEQAEQFHLEMWIWVHGAATMIATSYLDLDTESISAMMTDMYIGLQERFCGKGAV